MLTDDCGKNVNNSVEKYRQKMFIKNVKKSALVENLKNNYTFSHSFLAFKQVLISFSQFFSTVNFMNYNLLMRGFARFPQVSTNTITIIYIERKKEAI